MSKRFEDFSPELQAAVNAYDVARRASHYGMTPPMSDANKATIAPMILAAVEAYRAARSAGPVSSGEPVAWATDTSLWFPTKHVSECVTKLTRHAQPEYGFTTPLYAAPPPALPVDQVPEAGKMIGDVLPDEVVETVERFNDAIDAATRIHTWIYELADKDKGKVASREVRNYTFNEDDGGAFLYFRDNRVAAGGFMVRDLHNFTVSMKVFADRLPTTGAQDDQ